MKIIRQTKPNDYYVKIAKPNLNNRSFLTLSVVNDEFFNNEIIIKVLDDKIIFAKPTIDYNGKTYKNKNAGQKVFGITSYDIDINEGYYKLSTKNEDYREMKFKNLLGTMIA